MKQYNNAITCKTTAALLLQQPYVRRHQWNNINNTITFRRWMHCNTFYFNLYFTIVSLTMSLQFGNTRLFTASESFSDPNVWNNPFLFLKRWEEEEEEERKRYEAFAKRMELMREIHSDSSSTSCPSNKRKRSRSKKKKCYSLSWWKQQKGGVVS